VFLVSWRNISEPQQHLTWDDYVEQGVIAALGVARDIAGADKLSALGFCAGGTLLPCALAVLAARGQESVASVTLLTTMLDFSDTGELGLLVNETSLAAREAAIGQGGVLKVRELAQVFASLRANDLFWPYVVNGYLKGKPPPAFDLLFWNGDDTRDMTFKKMDKVNWDAVMRTNLDSLFNMSKQVVDGMVERNWGRVINVSSVNGSKGAFGQTNYSAAKAGVHGFTKALALEVARKNVTVNTISPGYIGTKMVTAIPKEVLDSKILPQIPVGRLGKPEEVAGLIIYLASEEAAFVTGANIAINGGQHMQ
jgi:NAD(P)-dependent dehydrogenase (short-subunit alcohol dehydrogenase family)